MFSFGKELNNKECRAISDCTSVEADLTLHFPQKSSMVLNDRIRVQSIIQKYSETSLVCNTRDSDFNAPALKDLEHIVLLQTVHLSVYLFVQT